MSNEGRCKTGNFKAVLAVLIVIFVTLSGSFKASAINKQIFITVKVNGNYIKMDTSVRFVAEALGAKVEWDGEDKKVTIKDDYNYIELFVGSKECYINAVKQAMDTSPEISNGRTMVPLRFVSDKNGIKVPEVCIYQRNYTDEDLGECLLRENLQLQMSY